MSNLIPLKITNVLVRRKLHSWYLIFKVAAVEGLHQFTRVGRFKLSQRVACPLVPPVDNKNISAFCLSPIFSTEHHFLPKELSPVA